MHFTAAPTPGLIKASPLLPPPPQNANAVILFYSSQAATYITMKTATL